MATPNRSYRKYRDMRGNVEGAEDSGSVSLLNEGDTHGTAKPRRYMSFWTFFLIVLGVIVLFLLGFCLGYYVRESLNSNNLTVDCTTARKDHFDEAEVDSLHETVMYYLSRETDKIVKFLKEFGNEDLLTNSILEKKLARTVEQELRDYQFDGVDTEEYSVVVTYPDPHKPNQLEVLNQTGSVLANFILKNSEVKGDNKGNHLGVAASYPKYPYVAYSPGGQAEGGLRYGHYGRRSDLLTLKSNGLEIIGHLLLLRLGQIPVSQKVEEATEAGATGVLLYWDPAEMDKDAPSNQSFIPYSSGKPDSQNAELFKVPVQTVSANIADRLLKHVGGVAAPKDWGGGLDAQYVLGNKYDTLNLRLTTYNKKREQIVQNVVGSIHGYAEPDRYVLVGTPRSSFPGSSKDTILTTAMFLQLARNLVFIQKRDRWKPRRGIKLISWGGAEFSNAGMMEHIKANSHLLRGRAIAYFDWSELVLGDQSLTALASPGLHSVISQAAQRVPDPVDSEMKVHDKWIQNARDKSSGKFSPFESYSEDISHQPFLHSLGIPEVRVQYDGNNKPVLNVEEMVEEESHHHFKYHIATARVLTLVMLRLIDDVILPFSVKDYAEDLHLTLWQSSGHLKECSQAAVKQKDLSSEVSLTDHLLRTADALDDFIKIYVENQDILGVKSVNEARLMFERTFISALNNKRSSQSMLYPVSKDGSIAEVSELCRTAKLTSNWKLVQNFKNRLNLALHEAIKCMRTNE